VSRTWTDVETGTIAARNNKYGREQQQAARYECKIVKKGLKDPLMRKVATQIAEECTSTDTFKVKLTQIYEFNRTRPEDRKPPAIGQKSPTTVTQSAIENEKRRETQCHKRREMKKEKRLHVLLTYKGCQERGNTYNGHTNKQCWDNRQAYRDNTPSCQWCRKHGHTTLNCWVCANHNAKRANQDATRRKKDTKKDFANGEW
jgi:hypothetical protein